MKELELFSFDGLGSVFRRNKGHSFILAPGQRCKNCDTELAGRFCHLCSQDADTHHRSIGHLIFEAFEGLFHLDGRIWQTLPPLFFNPGTLARDFMEERLARHVPPFRIFLIALLVFMLVAERASSQHEVETGHTRAMPTLESIQFKPVGTPLHPEALPQDVIVRQVTKADGSKDINVTRQINGLAISEDNAKFLADMVATSHMQPEWLKQRILRALENREDFMHAVFNWGHRLALLLLPIVGLILGGMYAGKKYRGKVYMYDHLLISMNLLSFLFLIMAVRMLLPDPIAKWAQIVTFGWTMINFYQTLRVGYGSTRLGAMLKTIILWLGTVFSFSVVLTIVILISLTAG